MYTIEVDGHVLPQPLAGHPALELCNTWAGWNSPPGAGGDYLVDFATLAVWAREQGLLGARETAQALAAADGAPGRAAQVLAETRRFRGHLYELLTSDVTAAPALTARIEEAQRALRLTPGERGGWAWRLAPDNPIRLPLLAAARAAGELLTAGGLAAVHACPGTDCGWLFWDPRGRRRWCTMAVCGNRAKARAHARRTSPRA